MAVNNYFGQLRSPFNANINLIENIINNNYYISKIGFYYIGNNNTTQVLIQQQRNNNWQSFQIGKTGILEFDNVHITGIKFSNAVPANEMIIDFRISTGDDLNAESVFDQ